MGKTLFDKLWDRHVITGEEGQAQLLYVDLHMIHEVTTPQAFEGLRQAGRTVRCPEKTFATMDHNVPTKDIFTITDLVAKKQMDTLRKNCRDFGIESRLGSVRVKWSMSLRHRRFGRQNRNAWELRLPVTCSRECTPKILFWH